MNKNEIWQAIDQELRRSKKKHPNWPDHVAAQAGIVCEESGELMKAALEYKYERSLNVSTASIQKEMLVKEAVHTAVTAIRFLENLK